MSDHWGTPPDFYERLDNEFHFTLDPCPLHSNNDGLLKSWANETVFVNPPYSAIGDWIDKAIKEMPFADHIIFLLPANRTDQKWFHLCLKHAYCIRFIKGRL